MPVEVTEERRAQAAKFRNWLLEEMRKRDWNQTDVANAAGVSKNAVGKWLRVEIDDLWRKPSYDSLRALAKALNVSLDTVLQAASMDRQAKSLSPLQQDVMMIVEQLPDAALEMIQPQLLGLLQHSQRQRAARRWKRRDQDLVN